MTGWSHISVFMAGANRNGLVEIQALATQVYGCKAAKTLAGFVMSNVQSGHTRRLSASPLAILAIVLADNGARSMTSAQSFSCMSSQRLRHPTSLHGINSELFTSMCSTGSPTTFHAIHSSSSRSNWILGSTFSLPHRLSLVLQNAWNCAHAAGL